LIVFGLDYFIIALVLFWFYLPLYTIIYHDWICHEYIKPKNKIIKVLLLLLFYSQENTVSKKKNYHIWHHKNFKIPKLDPTYQKMQGVPLLRYILSFHKPKEQNIPNLEFSLVEKDKFIKYCDIHYKKIWIGYIILSFMFLPLEWFATLNIFIPWISTCVANWHDYYFHGPIKGKDSNLLSVMIGTSAWHIHHHNDWTKEYYGNGIWKYLNPAWYYRIIFFK
jgi:hypothetical protein